MEAVTRLASRAWRAIHSSPGPKYFIVPPTDDDSFAEQDPPIERNNRGRRTRNIIAGSLAASLLFLILLLVSAGRYRTRKEEPVGLTVELDYGTYEGFAGTGGVNQFFGVRYAAAPTGDLRWRAPVEPLPFNGTQIAHESMPSCSLAEDCLFLDIFAPASATTTSNLPVWLYIQGGAYEGLCCNGNFTEVAAAGQVIVIGISYRVGALGFLASERIRENGDLNVALLDHRAAMKWTKKHIQKFGGNPDHIVIHGTSAGGGSVLHHLAAYGGRDEELFVGAIAHSSYVPGQLAVSDLEYQFDNAAQEVGCDTADDTMACLRSVDFDVINAISQHSYPFPGRQTTALRSYGPVIDGDLIPEGVLDLFAQGRTIDVPFMLGHAVNEAAIFCPNVQSSAEVKQFINKFDPTLDHEQLDAVVRQYPKFAVNQHTEYYGQLVKALSDFYFLCPSFEAVEGHAQKHESPVWMYQFNVSSNSAWENGLGAWHTVDSGAIFGPYYYGPDGPDTVEAYKTYNLRVKEELMNYHISFVKTLSPNTLKLDAAPTFELFGPGTYEQRLEFQNLTTSMQEIGEIHVENCKFWKETRAVHQGHAD